VKKVHFIAIGGSAMHNLALALHESGYQITGSDDEIREPSYSRLKKAGLLPETIGWFPEKIHGGLDAVIVGMHARSDNTELIRAMELNIPVYSYPEFIYKASEHTVRVVIGGSHGKTTTTAMLLHVLKKKNISLNYLVGAQLEGFTNMVHLHPSSTISVFEGDEYLTSPLDPRPKFHLYKPHIAILTGIAWDHINVFPTFEIYLDQFRIFIDTMERFGTLIYDAEDEVLRKLVEEHPRKDVQKIPYSTPPFQIDENRVTHIEYMGKKFPLAIFGRHNLKNLEAASLAYVALGYNGVEFRANMVDFKGAAGRMEIWHRDEKNIVIRDFAHAPSKVSSTLRAVREQFPEYRVYAFFELHTFSSLNKNFLPQYKNTLDASDVGIIFYDLHTLEHKKMPPLEKQFVYECFAKENAEVIDDPVLFRKKLKEVILSNEEKKVILLMSSGTFEGLSRDDVLTYCLKKNPA